MNKTKPNLQDSFLNQIRKDGEIISIYLTSGFLLRGTVKAFDTFTLLLEDKGKQHLIYKHGIASIGVGTSEPIRIEDQ